MTPFFITSTGTGIGKTLITCALTWQLRQQGRSVTALKPCISGYSPHDPDNDSGLILKACGITPTPALMETISPWRYTQALAPSMAARIDGNPVDFDALVKFCRDHESLQSDILLAEGCGGLMAPITDRHTVLDWIEALDWPIILVAGNYLGSISHTLTTMEVIKMRRLKLASIVLSESYERAVDLVQTADTLAHFITDPVPLVKIPRVAERGETWKHVPPISWIC